MRRVPWKLDIAAGITAGFAAIIEGGDLHVHSHGLTTNDNIVPRSAFPELVEMLRAEIEADKAKATT